MSNTNDDRTPLLGGLSFRRRERGDMGFVRHVVENKMTWDLYKIVFATSAVSQVIYELPYKLHGVNVVGMILYVLSLLVFLVTLIAHVIRFAINPSLLPDSLTHPSESLATPFLPASLGLLIINASTYASRLGVDNHRALRVFYWIYIALTAVFSVASPLALSSRTARNRAQGLSVDNTARLLNFTLPLLLVGPVSAAVLSHAKPIHAASVMGSAIGLGGTGLVLTLFSLGRIFADSLTGGVPEAPHTPSMFLAPLVTSLASYGATGLGIQALRLWPQAVKVPEAGGKALIAGVLGYYGFVGLGVVLLSLATWWGVVTVVGVVAPMVTGEVRGVGFRSWMVVAAHAAWTLAGSRVLSLMHWKFGALIIEVVGVVTAVVWVAVAAMGIVGVVTGRLLHDRE